MARSFVWSIVALGIIGSALLALTYYYSNYLVSPIGSNQPNPSDKGDLNWAGYAVSHNFSDPKPLVTGVSGTWTVPSVALSENDTFSAVWVGIGGYFGKSLIQAGTEQDCIGATAYYSAWFELLPADSITIQALDISPGDVISASITLSSPDQNMWTIFVSDLSTGKSYNQDFSYNSSRLSAEWIVERPNVDNSLSQLTNFESVTMSNCSATINDEAAVTADFPSVRISMYDSNGIRLTNTSTLSNDGSSFTVTTNQVQIM